MGFLNQSTQHRTSNMQHLALATFLLIIAPEVLGQTTYEDVQDQSKEFHSAMKQLAIFTLVLYLMSFVARVLGIDPNDHPAEDAGVQPAKFGDEAKQKAKDEFNR